MNVSQGLLTLQVKNFVPVFSTAAGVKNQEFAADDFNSLCTKCLILSLRTHEKKICRFKTITCGFSSVCDKLWCSVVSSYVSCGVFEPSICAPLRKLQVVHTHLTSLDAIWPIKCASNVKFRKR